MSAFAQLDTLMEIIAARAGADVSSSHVAKMLKKGPIKIAKKVGEEGVEVALAAASGERSEIISESADLLFHLLLLWHAHGITPEEAMAELQRREGMSGIAEKASRKDV